MSPGEAPRLLELPPPLGPVAVAICYELSDGLGLNQAVRDGAGWLLTIANLDPYPLLCSSSSRPWRSCARWKPPDGS